jgi:GTPase SAR1 family protein
MGICTARSNDLQTLKSKRIDSGLREHAQIMHNTVKMILLGPGESGKSTVFKQMKIIQDAGGFSHEECMAFIPVVHSNCISQMKVLITAATNLQISFSSKAACDAAERLLQLYQQGTSMSEEIAGIIKVLWADNGIKTVHDMRGRKYQLNDTADYFFQNVARISNSDYVPTHEDILRARVRSTGIEEAQFTFEQLTFTVVDVGGQRAERRKWIYCFENVRVVLFCAAISGYDQTLREDSSQNRMDEAILLFEEVTNSGYFSPETAILLFLNKQDLFQEKYPRVPLTLCFPDYTGSTIDDARKFIEDRFLEKIRTSKTEVYVHHTCALNTQNMRFVITAIRKELLKDDLKQIIPSDSIL